MADQDSVFGRVITKELVINDIEVAPGAGGFAMLDGAGQVPAAQLGNASGGMGLIEEIVVPAGGLAIVTSAALPTTYKDLMILVEGRCEGAVPADDLCLRFNGDSGNNYDHSSGVMSNGIFYSRGAGVSSMAIGYLVGASAPAGHAARTNIQVFNYRGTTFHKGLTAQGSLHQGVAAGDQWTRSSAGAWRNTAAITSVSFLALGGSDILAGSVIRIYGIK